MKFVLTIKTDGAAFTRETSDEDNGTPEPAPEVARLLRLAAEGVEDGEQVSRLFDINGNNVGSFHFVEGD